MFTFLGRRAVGTTRSFDTKLDLIRGRTRRKSTGSLIYEPQVGTFVETDVRQKRVLTVVLTGTFWNSQICPTLYTIWLRRTPTSQFGKEQKLNQCTKISRYKESQAISTPSYNTLDSRAYIGRQVMGSSATKTQESVLCVEKFHTSRTTFASPNTYQPAIGTSPTLAASVARPSLSRARKLNFQALLSYYNTR